MADLSTRYLGLELRNPFVASASPMCGDLDGLRHLEDSGAAAVVLPSLFEEQIVHEAVEVDRFLSMGADSFAESLSMFPELGDYNTGPDRYLHLIETAKYTISIPVVASLNGASPGGWEAFAKRIEDAGADALELNAYIIAADPDVSGVEIERRYMEMVGIVSESVTIPVAVKIGPYFSSLPHVAKLLIESGARGLVLFNRFYQPDLDIEHLEVAPRLQLSTSDDLRLPLRWIAILRNRIGASLAASGGVHEATDAIKVLLAGADVAMTTSALLKNGAQHLAVMLDDLNRWLDEHDYASVHQMRGSMSQAAVEDPSAFERANYMRTLLSYSPKTPL